MKAYDSLLQSLYLYTYTQLWCLCIQMINLSIIIYVKNGVQILTENIIISLL